MNFRTRSCLAVAIAAVFPACTSCDPAPQDEVPIIKLGIVLDQTGTSAAPSWGASANLAVEHVNAALKRANVNVQFQAMLVDSTSTAATTVTLAKDLVHNQGVKGLVLDLSRSSIDVNKVNYATDGTPPLDVPQICILCTSGDINNPTIEKPTDLVEQAALRNERRWQYRTTTKQSMIIDQVLSTILTAGPNGNGDINGDGHVRISLINANDNSGRSFRSSFEALTLARLPGAEIENIYVEPDLTVDSYDWAAALGRLSDDVNSDTETTTTKTTARPDAIMESLTASFSTALIKVYAQGDKSIVFYHAHGFRHPRVQLQLGTAINGQQGVSHVLLDNGAAGELFALELKRASGIDPQYLDSHAYDATVLLALGAIAGSNGMAARASVTGAQVRDGMLLLNNPAGLEFRTGTDEFARALEAILRGDAVNYEGASGSLDFDATGNALGKLAHYVGTDGQWAELERYDCTQAGCPEVP